MIIKSPDNTILDSDQTTIFLAGSIENGSAIDWQADLETWIETNKQWIIWNPRRQDWDQNIRQVIDEPRFYEQVTWELKRIIQYSKIITFYFDPNTTSPITLLELGICLGMHKQVLVCCPEGYYRKGNVDIICDMFGITVLNSLDALKSELSKIE